MQPQESHEQIPVRQSPCEAAQEGQAVLMGQQKHPLLTWGPKTRERTRSTPTDGPTWNKQWMSRLPDRSLGETG